MRSRVTVGGHVKYRTERRASDPFPSVVLGMKFEASSLKGKRFPTELDSHPESDPFNLT